MIFFFLKNCTSEALQYVLLHIFPSDKPVFPVAYANQSTLKPDPSLPR